MHDPWVPVPRYKRTYLRTLRLECGHVVGPYRVTAADLEIREGFTVLRLCWGCDERRQASMIQDLSVRLGRTEFGNP